VFGLASALLVAIGWLNPPGSANNGRHKRPRLRDDWPRRRRVGLGTA